ncbi:MAG TPA: cobalamin-binding protein [Burkholderiales bacterium]|nr:cobalamin-binding protein [Burkholderiales bacterium]
MSRIVAFVLLVISINAFGQAQVRDDYGNLVSLARPAERIVSLAPHLTELLYDAGAGGRVVGAIQYSDYPPAARALPRVGSDAGIDLEAVLALHPDLVVAWPNAGSARSIDRLEALGIPVFRSEPRELDDIARTLERLGALAGTPQAAARAAASFRARVRRLRERYSERPAVRVFYEVWNRPLQTVNGRHVISKVMRLCGGVNVFADLPSIAPLIDREAVLRANPQVIVASGLGAQRPGWLDDWKVFPGLAAAARGQLYFIPADLIQRHTRRLLDGAERLCRILEEVRTAR